jgi:hypothetical protein
MACLVQQLFRQKVGKGCCQDLIDEVIFPLLFIRKYLPYGLYLDIRMIHNITIYPLSLGLYLSPVNRPPMVPEKVPPFDPACFGRTHLRMLTRCGQEGRLTEGRHTSKFRRKKMGKRNWGSVDILNELRSLKHPRMGYYHTEWDSDDLFADEFDNAYLLLEEDESIPGTSDWCIAREKSRLGRLKFVNGFLDDLINTGKRPSWGENPFQPMLCQPRDYHA